MLRSALPILVALSAASCASAVVPIYGSTDASDAADSSAIDAFDAPPMPCGTTTCAPGQICIQGECGGCCMVPPHCIPIPRGCAGAPACGCFASNPCACTTCLSVDTDGIHCGNCLCTCAAPWTPIETPEGPRAIATLHVGDLVFSVDHGEVIAVPIARTGHRAVVRHAVVRLVLESGDVIEMSGGHPTADGRTFAMLGPGDSLGRARVASVEMVPYDEPFTYDILPASDSGTYFVSGAWIGSTMH
jgi:hypothetical protein